MKAHELARELGISQKDLVNFLQQRRLSRNAAALGPAKVESVSIDRSTRTATVMVPRTQLSLAIGRDGQNARLAAKLTGFRIDIKPSDSEPLPDAEEPA